MARVALGGMVVHVLNRGVALMQLFEKPADYKPLREFCANVLTNHRCEFAPTR
jgi:hypothetical protein